MTAPMSIDPARVLHEQVAPGDPGPVPVDDPLHDLTVITERTRLLAHRRRQKRGHPSPLLVRQQREMTHPTSTPNAHSKT
jgi:hypothetical protein